MSTHVLKICAKFHWNLSTKYEDIASRAVDVNVQRPDGRTDGQPEYMTLCAAAPTNVKEAYK